MTLFLTSCIGPREPGGSITGIYRDNGFLEQVKQRWHGTADILIMAASPESPRNDGWIDVVKLCCHDGGLPFGRVDICDDRDLSFAERISDYDVVVLAGGHPQTQNAFFHAIGLKRKLAGFDGIIIGISAGSMNAAALVYTHVERLGEEKLSKEERFLPGLALTETMILPHFQELRETTLGGKHVINEVALPDSVGHEFICLNDGSYILAEAGREVLFGEAYRMKDGILDRICRNGESVILA